MTQPQPVSMTITRVDDHTYQVHGSTIDVILLRILAERSDRTALKHIRRLWGVDLPTARLLMKAAREGTEQP